VCINTHLTAAGGSESQHEEGATSHGRASRVSRAQVCVWPKLLTLRTRIALTQIELAEQIGIHRRSLQKWETGESYPKAETLQRLIAVLLRHHAFLPGHERAEAEALWSQAAEDGLHPLAAFDNAWFDRTLALQGSGIGVRDQAAHIQKAPIPGP